VVHDPVPPGGPGRLAIGVIEEVEGGVDGG
jgi:hypothetical protein